MICFNLFCRGDCCIFKILIIVVDFVGNIKLFFINFFGENEFGISSYIKVSICILFKLIFISNIEVGMLLN